MRETYPPGTRVWVRAGPNYDMRSAQRAIVIGKTSGGKYVFRRWNPRLRRWIRYPALREHILKRVSKKR